MRSAIGAAMAAALLSGCAMAGSKSAKPAIAINPDPYPSTYRVYPGAPTLIRNVTILDGEGGRIENGDIVFADGKVQALGTGLVAPAGDSGRPKRR